MVTQLVGDGAAILIALKAFSPNQYFSLGKVETTAIHCVTWQNHPEGLKKNEHFLQLAGQVISYFTVALNMELQKPGSDIWLLY